MRRMRGLSALSITLLLVALGALAGQAAASGITNAGDDLRTGWYPNSSAITPQLVSGGTFGQLWSASVEGSVYAQPLLDNGTLLVATEKNRVYGLDQSTGAVKWEKELGTPWNPNDLSCGDLTPSIGVTATPVIDTATNIAYMTHKTYVSGTSGPARWYMDAISMSSGAEQPGFPVELSGAAQNDPARVFEPKTQLQRPGLLLLEGVVYAAFGSHCDREPWQGWIFGVSTAGTVTARYVDNTTKEGAGIWQSGAGLTSDGPGTILFSTGNGGAPSEPAAGANPPANLGESVVRVRVQPDGSLKAVDFFAPFDAPKLDEYDADFASGGVTALPSEYFGTPAVPHLAVAVGKQGYVYLLNRDSLGGIAQGPGGADNVVQRLGPRGGVWSRPGVWPGDGGYVYIPTSSGSSAGGKLDVYKYGLSGGGAPSLSLAASSEDAFGWGSGAPVITSAGTTSGTALVWVIWSTNRTGAGGQLRAYDPVPVAGKPVLRFTAPIGTASNYSTPGVGAGKLFVGTREGKVLAFGSPITPPLVGSALSFPRTTIGEPSKPQTLTLKANEALKVAKLTSSSSEFTLGTPSPALGSELSEGQTISVPVTFNPTEAGLVGATVTATTGTGKQAQFAVSGTGQFKGPHLVFSPPLIAFEGTAIDGQREETATFSNDGSEALQINKVQLPSSPFGVEGAPKAGDKIASGQSLTVSVRFEPTRGGSFPDAIALQTTGGEAKIGIVATAGTPGLLQIDHESNDFGSVPVGASATRLFTVTNVGQTAVTITKSKPPDGGEFAAVSSLPEGTTVQAGESITEQVAFAPTVAGDATGEWQVHGEDTSGLHSIQFTGTGTNPVAPSPSPTAPAQVGAVHVSLPEQGVLPLRETAVAPSPDARLAGTSFTETRSGTLRLRVSCPVTVSSCSGKIALALRVSRPVSSGGAGSRRSVLLTLAAGSFTVRGGQDGTVTVRLSAQARALLARLHVLRALVTISAHDPAGLAHTAHATITIRAAAARR